MLFFVIGLPGRFGEGCEAVVAGAVRDALGAVRPISADTLEEITQRLLCSGSAHGVVAARHPGGRIRHALIEARRPFIVVQDDPWMSLAHLVVGRGMAMPAAIRQVASSCASVIGFGSAPGALVLDAKHSNLMSAARAIADHLQLEIADGVIRQIVGSLDGERDLVYSSETAAWQSELDPREREIASGALGPYLDSFPGGGLGPIVWAPELFFAGDSAGAPGTGGVDITGRARCLLRGPHILIPPANWSFAITLDVSAEAAEHNFVVEAAGGAVTSRTVIRPAGAGIVEAELTLSLEELPDRPIELVLSNQRPAFGGHLSLLSVTATPQPSPPAVTSSEGAARNPDLQPITQ